MSGFRRAGIRRRRRATYAQVVLADSPAAYWPMDDASPGSLREVVASRNATAVSGGGQLAQQPGLPFPGVKVSGKGYRFTPNMALLGAEYSVECWVSFDQFVSGNLSGILGVSGTGAHGWRRFVRVGQGTTTTAKADSAQSATAGTDATAFASPDLTSNTVYHLVCTYTAGSAKWYVNGSLVSTANVTNGTPTSVTNMVGHLLAGWAADDTVWQTYGTFAHLATYNKVLSDARIQAHYQAALGYTVIDDFNRADGAVGAASSGPTWTNTTGYGISGNRLVATAANGGRLLLNTGKSNVDLRATYRVVPSGGYVAMYGRHADADNYARLVIYRDAASAFQIVAGGAFAQNVNLGTITPNDGDVFALKMVNSTYEVYRNGTLLASATYTNATLAAAKSHGFQMSHATSAVDDFRDYYSG